MLSLNELRNIERVQEDKLLRNSNDNFNHLSRSLRSKNVIFAVGSFVLDHDILKSKQYLFNCALLDEYRIKHYQDRMLDFALPQICLVLLSDNWEYLEKKYSKLRYDVSYIDDNTNEKHLLSMDDMVLQGESAVWSNTLQLFIANDTEGIERNLKIIETLTLPKITETQKELEIDYEFFKALFYRDVGKCEELLELLVSPKIHKKRNDNPVLNQYISLPALGYAKLAWRKGIEVEVNSPLVPKELLPIQPLDHYDIPYDFLKTTSPNDSSDS